MTNLITPQGQVLRMVSEAEEPLFIAEDVFDVLKLSDRAVPWETGWKGECFIRCPVRPVNGIMIILLMISMRRKPGGLIK